MCRNRCEPILALGRNAIDCPNLAAFLYRVATGLADWRQAARFQPKSDLRWGPQGTKTGQVNRTLADITYRSGTDSVPNSILAIASHLARATALAGLAFALSACQVLNVAGTVPGAKEDLAVSLTPNSNPVTVDTVGRGDRFAKLAAAQHPKILATYGLSLIHI